MSRRGAFLDGLARALSFGVPVTRRDDRPLLERAIENVAEASRRVADRERGRS